MIDDALTHDEPSLGQVHRPPSRDDQVPTSRPDHVVRPRLLELLDQGVQGQLTLVSAPAGCGKTSLVASWAASCEWPLLWMTLEPADADARVFWGRLAAGLEGLGVDFSDLASRRNQASGGSEPPSRVVRSLSARQQPVVLVLDAGGTTSDSSRDRALAEILVGAQDCLRLILITRSDPVFPMEWFRLAGALTEIRAADLAANEEETVELLLAAGMIVTAAEAEALCARTGGWMVALKFAIMSLADVEDVSSAIQRFSDTDFDIVTYLFTKVIHALPLEIRDLLLRTSVVDVLTPGLVHLLAAQPFDGDVLEFLANGNQFIERTTVGSQICYRYQPLFRDFLRAQFAFERPALNRELRQSASKHSSSPGGATRFVAPAQRSPEPQRARGDEIIDLTPSDARPGLAPSEGLVVERLTPREQEVLGYLAELLPTAEISLLMFVSVNTVRTHIRSILRKLGVARRHEAVRRAWKLGLLPSPEDELAR